MIIDSSYTTTVDLKSGYCFPGNFSILLVDISDLHLNRFGVCIILCSLDLISITFVYPSIYSLVERVCVVRSVVCVCHLFVQACVLLFLEAWYVGFRLTLVTFVYVIQRKLRNSQGTRR